MHACDLISRQAAIDDAEEWIEAVYCDRGEQRERYAIKHVIAGIKALPSAQPEPIWGLPVSAERPLADVEIVSCLRTIQKQVGGSYAIGRAIEIIEAVASAQPEIIRCKDCKWKQGSECVRFAEVRPFPDDFCSRAERKSDE